MAARIALLGDIHANLPAFEAALRAASKAGVDHVVHTGNLVGLGPFPVEVIRCIEREGIRGVRGNYDEAAAFDYDLPGGILPEDPWAKDVVRALRFTQSALDVPSREYLRDLPFEYRLLAGGRRVVVYHANPLDNVTPLPEDRPAHVYEEVVREAGADVVVVGHTRRPYHKVVLEVHLINAGSVGMPLDDDPRAHLVVLSVDGRIGVDIEHVEYDVETTVAGMTRARLPGTLAEALRVGRTRAA